MYTQVFTSVLLPIKMQPWWLYRQIVITEVAHTNTLKCQPPNVECIVYRFQCPFMLSSIYITTLVFPHQRRILKQLPAISEFAIIYRVIYSNCIYHIVLSVFSPPLSTSPFLFLFMSLIDQEEYPPNNRNKNKKKIKYWERKTTEVWLSNF